MTTINRCSDCGDALEPGQEFETSTGGHICPVCYTDNYFTCVCCGKHHDTNNYCAEGLCFDCAGRDEVC